jgi:hypothetical protein
MIPIGTRVKYGGVWRRVSAVGWVGERYYWLTRTTDINDTVMVPAAIVEDK